MYYNITDEQSKRINILKMLFALFVVLIHSDTGDINFSNEIISADVPVWLEYYKYFLSEAISRCAVPGFYCIASLLLYRKEFTWKII